MREYLMGAIALVMNMVDIFMTQFLETSGKNVICLIYEYYLFNIKENKIKSHTKKSVLAIIIQGIISNKFEIHNLGLALENKSLETKEITGNKIFYISKFKYLHFYEFFIS